MVYGVNSPLLFDVIVRLLNNCGSCYSIKTLPPLVFENLNSLETLNLQNNKLTHVPEEVIEPVVDTVRVIDITGNQFTAFREK